MFSSIPHFIFYIISCDSSRILEGDPTTAEFFPQHVQVTIMVLLKVHFEINYVVNRL